MKKSFVHSGGRLRKTLSLMLFVLLLAIFLGACGNKNDSKNPERIIVSTASKETLALPNGYDKVCAIVKSDENLLIISEKDSSPCVLAFDSNLALFSERKLDIPDKNNAHICGISSNSEGFSILFSSSPQRTAEVMYIGFYDKTGQLKKSIPLNDLTPNYMGPVVTSEGEYLLWNPSTILLFDETGHQKINKKLSGFELINVSSFQSHIFALLMKDQEFGICEINLKNGDLGKFKKINTSPASYNYAYETGSGILVNTAEQLCEYYPKTSKHKELFAWNIISERGDEIDYIVPIDTGFLAYLTKSHNTVNLIKYGQREAVREKLLVGTIGKGKPELDKLVAEFNSSNTDYYAQIEHYNDNTQLSAALIAGKGPDVLEISDVGIPLASRNFIDLYPFIEQTPEMKSPYFVQPVLDSLKIDGKLTSIPSSFCIKTVVGKSEDVGKKSGWTIEELDRALEQKGKSCSAFPGWLTSNELMLWICDISLGQFIDWNLLKSDFNNDDFISLLKFCKDTPKEFDASTYSGDYTDNILLTVQFIQNHNYLETMRKNYGSGDITYIGFPNNNGNNGSFFACTQNDIQLAIPAFSEKQSSAWQFIKLMLTDKIQASVNNFPIVNAQLKSRLYSLSNRKDSSMDKTEIEKFYSLIEDTVLFTHSDSIIRDIVISEVGAFFNGEKTAEDVAMQITSRVNIYLSETK